MHRICSKIYNEIEVSKVTANIVSVKYTTSRKGKEKEG